MPFTLWGLYQYNPNLFKDVIVPTSCDKSLLIDVIMERSGMLYPRHQQPTYLERNIANWFRRREPAFSRMFEALEAEYSPIENYDRQEEWTDSPDITKTMSGGHTNENVKTGEYRDTLRKSGIIRETFTKDGAEKTVEFWAGGHKNVYDSEGTDDTQNKVSAYNSNAYEPDSQQLKDTTSNGSDIFSYQGEEKTTDQTFTDRMDTRSTNFQDYKEEHTIYRPSPGEKEVDTFTYNAETQKETGTQTHQGRVHGNIGVTTAQKMIEEELNLRRYDLYNVIAELFETEFLSQIY